MGARTSSIPPETSDPEVRRILDGLRRIVKVLRESSRDAQKVFGMSAAQLFALQKLAGQPPLSLSQLAQLTMTHESSISVVVRRLVERGLVNRTRSAADGRQVEITLTPEGKAVLKKAPAAATAKVIAGIEKLSVPERKELSMALGRLVDAMGIAACDAPMLFDDEESDGGASAGA